MRNRNSIAFIVIIFLLVVDLLIYKYRQANTSKEIISCYPAAKAYSQKQK